MKIPVLSEEVRDKLQYILIRSTYSDGLVYLGEHDGGYFFSHKIPKRLQGLYVGERSFLYIKSNQIFAVDVNSEDLFYIGCELLDNVDEDKCYMITKDDEV